jgi:hypothetical protein
VIVCRCDCGDSNIEVEILTSIVYPHIPHIHTDISHLPHLTQNPQICKILKSKTFSYTILNIKLYVEVKREGVKKAYRHPHEKRLKGRKEIRIFMNNEKRTPTYAKYIIQSP